MQAYIGDVTEDVVVQTTINWDLQKEAEFVVREAVANEGTERGFSQGALVAMDVDGTVRALVGGIDYGQSQFNRAVTGRRQPGSAFKPFVYLAAMEKGYTPDTVADDAPFDYNGWSPHERLRQVRRPGDAARRARLFAQHRLRPPRHRRRPADRGRCRDAHGHLLAAWTPCPRSRSAPPRSRCSS